MVNRRGRSKSTIYSACSRCLPGRSKKKTVLCGCRFVDVTYNSYQRLERWNWRFLWQRQRQQRQRQTRPITLPLLRMHARGNKHTATIHHIPTVLTAYHTRLPYLELNSPHSSPDQEDVPFVDGTISLKEVRLQENIKEIAGKKRIKLESQTFTYTELERPAKILNAEIIIYY